MNKKVTPRRIHRSPPFNVEDVRYVPLADHIGKKRVNNIYYPEIQNIIKHLPVESRTPSGFLVELALKKAYSWHMANNLQEPQWMKCLNASFKREIRVLHEIQEHSTIVPLLPFAGFGYMVEEDGLIEDIIQVFGIRRLSAIRQLAFLRDPAIRENNPNVMAQPFNHTRFVHSLDVLAVMGLLIHNNRYAPVNGKKLWDYRHYAFIAAVSHDTLTPAGGDTMKALDFEAFDEDKQYHTLFKKEGWSRIRDKYKLDEELLYATVQGKGVLGQMLDIADKIAYTSRDVWEFWNTLHIQNMENPVELSYDLMEIGNEIEDNPLITSLWQHAIVKDEKIVFDNIEAVTNFLRLRARMFKGVYANPTSRFPEYLVSQFIGKKMYEQGILTKEFLLSKTDWELESCISEFVEIPDFTHTILNHIRVEVSLFATNKDALLAQAKLNGSISFIEKCESRTKSGVDSFLALKDDRIMTVREAAPFQTEVITSILKEDTSYRLYKLNLSMLTEEVKAKITNLCKE